MIGKYKIIRTLGSGTTAKVKLAQNSETGENVAIKIVAKSHFESKPDLQRKIHREIALMKLLDHPHLLKLIEVYDSAHHLYIVLEFASHGELFDYLVERRSLNSSSAMNFFRQLIYGLEYLHNHAICHRDLKPENILLDANDHVKIADFGFARWMRANIAETSCGSPHYAAPEVIRGDPYDGRSADIWSCGIILYALLAGRLPFDDPSIRNLLAKVKVGHFIMPNFQPAIIQDLIARMLTVDVTSRITIQEIKNHPAFHIDLPEDYIIPKPLPLPYVGDPIDPESVEKTVLISLRHLGYKTDDDIYQELSSPANTMAKLFNCMLTSKINIESLPWAELSNEQEFIEKISQEAFLMDPKPTVSSFSLQGRDNFFRRPKVPSAGSPDYFSLAQKVSWADEASVEEFQSEHVFDFVTGKLEYVITQLQKRFKADGVLFFYPNDLTLITHVPNDNSYSIIFFEYAESSEIKIILRQIQGTITGFQYMIMMIDNEIKQ